MTEKELKRLSRADLLVMLIDSRKEVEDLKTRLEEVESELQTRTEVLTQKFQAESAEKEEKLRTQLSETKERFSVEKADLEERLTTRLTETKERLEAEKADLEERLTTRLTETREKLQAEKAETEEKLKAQLQENQEKYQREREETEQKYQAKMEEADQKLQRQDLIMEKAGSIAEASLLVNGVFEAVQKAADQYLDSVKAKVARNQEECEENLKQSRIQAAQMLMETEKACQEMKEKAKTESQQYWDDVNSKIQEIMDTHGYLQNLFKLFDIGKPNKN